MCVGLGKNQGMELLWNIRVLPAESLRLSWLPPPVLCPGDPPSWPVQDLPGSELEAPCPEPAQAPGTWGIWAFLFLCSQAGKSAHLSQTAAPRTTVLRPPGKGSSDCVHCTDGDTCLEVAVIVGKVPAGRGRAGFKPSLLMPGAESGDSSARAHHLPVPLTDDGAPWGGREARARSTQPPRRGEDPMPGACHQSAPSAAASQPPLPHRRSS